MGKTKKTERSADTDILPRGSIALWEAERRVATYNAFGRKAAIASDKRNMEKLFDKGIDIVFCQEFRPWTVRGSTVYLRGFFHYQKEKYGQERTI